jgi:hypothetical protein
MTVSEGPPMTCIPVVRKPWDDPKTCVGCSVIGYERVDVVRECPIFVSREYEGEKRCK